jgi:hypothetical protein
VEPRLPFGVGDSQGMCLFIGLDKG